MNKKNLTENIILFLRQLSDLLSSGITLMHGLEILERNQENKDLRILFYRLKKHVSTGQSFSIAIAHYPIYFDALTCQLIKIGEYTGHLEYMLNMIANHKEEFLNNNKKIKQALFYPTLTLILGMLITLSLFYFIIPKFVNFFNDMHISLPFYTKVLCKISIWLHEYTVFLIFLFTITCIYLTKKSPTKDYLYKIGFCIPVIKKILHKNHLSNFASLLSLTLSAGIPIIEALTMVAGACPKYLANLIEELKLKTMSGIALNHAMHNNTFFPALMIQMIEVGEEAGKLPAMLEKIANFYDFEVKQLTAYISKTVEPLIMLILGVLIGGLVLVLYLPIFELGSAL